MRVVKHWRRLLLSVVEYPSLQIFKICLDLALGKLLKVTLLCGLD